jgi:hypothetical protein
MTFNISPFEQRSSSARMDSGDLEQIDKKQDLDYKFAVEEIYKLKTY